MKEGFFLQMRPKCLESQGYLVSRLITPVTHIVPLILSILLTYLLRSHDPSSANVFESPFNQKVGLSSSARLLNLDNIKDLGRINYVNMFWMG